MQHGLILLHKNKWAIRFFPVDYNIVVGEFAVIQLIVVFEIAHRTFCTVINTPHTRELIRRHVFLLSSILYLFAHYTSTLIDSQHKESPLRREERRGRREGGTRTILLLYLSAVNALL